jgi:la-related protein 1
MTTTQSRTSSDAATTPVAFSYAQAAKGLSAAPAPATAPAVNSSKPSSDTTAPSKDADFVPSTLAAASMSWADDVEATDLPAEKPVSIPEDQSSEATPAPKEDSAPEQPILESDVSSPDLGASSSSTVTKDDDVSSLPNTSSESTWENKSQASTSVDKSVEPAEKTSEKVKGKALERSTFKPLQEAPLPAVNIWKLRAEESKAKAIQRPPPAKSALAGSSPAIANGVVNGSSGPGAKKNRGVVGADKGDSREKASTAEHKAKGREEDKTTQAKKDAKPEMEFDKAKKGVKGRSLERDAKAAATVVPPPPARDQESWPTPETAIDEDRKKSQSKGEKTERERKESVSAGAHGKQEWVKVPYTPTVVFNTPLPGAASARRGGGRGGRGGAQTGGRPAGYAAGGAGQPEKDGSAPSVLPNGDQPKRGQSDGPTTHDASPPKSKRAGSAGSPTLKEKSQVFAGDKSSKSSLVPETEASVLTESAASTQTPAQPNSFTRQYPSNRPNKGRRGDIPNQGERRKDGEVNSPTKENAGSHDRQASVATQIDG